MKPDPADQGAGGETLDGQPGPGNGFMSGMLANCTWVRYFNSVDHSTRGIEVRAGCWAAGQMKVEGISRASAPGKATENTASRASMVSSADECLNKSRDVKVPGPDRGRSLRRLGREDRGLSAPGLNGTFGNT